MQNSCKRRFQISVFRFQLFSSPTHPHTLFTLSFSLASGPTCGGPSPSTPPRRPFGPTGWDRSGRRRSGRGPKECDYRMPDADPDSVSLSPMMGAEELRMAKPQNSEPGAPKVDRFLCARTPHVQVASTTGSGSDRRQRIVTGIVMNSSALPGEVTLSRILISPKGASFGISKTRDCVPAS